jgi:hypothetical protein
MSQKTREEHESDLSYSIQEFEDAVRSEAAAKFKRQVAHAKLLEAIAAGWDVMPEVKP